VYNTEGVHKKSRYTLIKIIIVIKTKQVM